MHVIYCGLLFMIFFFFIFIHIICDEFTYYDDIHGSRLYDGRLIIFNYIKAQPSPRLMLSEPAIY